MEPSAFDPYRKWLGIRTVGGPPNHYRLLGLELFESDADVICHAADARIAHVRNFCSGPHQALAEKILQELKTAKATLLDPAQKAAYDRALRAELAQQGEELSAASSAGPPPLPAQNLGSSTGAWANPVEEQAPAASLTAPPAQIQKNLLLWVGGGVLLLLVISVAILGVSLTRRANTANEVAQTDTADLTATAGLPETHAGPEEASPPGSEKKHSAPTPPSDSEKSEKAPTSPADSEKAPTSPSDSEKKEPSSSEKTSSEKSLKSSGQGISAGGPGAEAGAGTQTSPGAPTPAEAQPAQSGTTPAGSAPSGSVTPSASESGGKEEPAGTPSPKGEPVSKEASGGRPSEAGGEKSPSEKGKESQTPPGSATPTQPSGASEKPPPQPSKEETSPGAEKSFSPAPSSSPAAENQRWPVPSPEDQKRAEATVRELFKKELSEAKLPAQKLALADKLFQEAQATKDDPAAAYVLFGMASALAAAGGDLTTSIEMIETAAGRFEMNSASLKLDVLNKALPGLRSGPQPALLAYELADLALNVMEDAILTDQIELAVEAYKLASGIVKRSGDNDLTQEVLSRNHCIQVFQKQYEAFRAAEKQLSVHPDDPAAHATLGRWHCFWKGLWEKGLPHLARAQPAELAALAQADLQSPENPKEQFQLAERWLQYAESESEEAKGHIQLRAAHWYRQALPDLSGLEKLTAQKQLEKLPTVPPLFTRRERGEVVPGNVALQIAGAQVTGTNTTGTYLIDGAISESSIARGTSPVTWTIVLPKLYRLREIRLLLVEPHRVRPRHYGYIIAVSKDGKRFVPLVDRSKGQWMGWQVIDFPARPVRAIQLIGLRESGERDFYVGELEAYCIPPQSPPGTPSEPPPGVCAEEAPLGPGKKHRPDEDQQPAQEKQPPDKQTLPGKQKPSGQQQPTPRDKKPREKPFPKRPG